MVSFGSTAIAYLEALLIAPLLWIALLTVPLLRIPLLRVWLVPIPLLLISLLRVTPIPLSRALLLVMGLPKSEQPRTPAVCRSRVGDKCASVRCTGMVLELL